MVFQRKAKRNEWIIIIPIWIMLLIIIVGISNWSVQNSQCKKVCVKYGYYFERRANYDECLCREEVERVFNRTLHFVPRVQDGGFLNGSG